MVHAYHHSKSRDRKNKIEEALFAVGSPIVASALSTIGASAFLFGCRTWVFIELGILICSITSMALLYTMTFLFAWLAIAGPLPIDQHGYNDSHRWDLKAMCWIPCQKDKLNSSIDTTYEKSEQRDDDDGSVYSIEVVEEADDDDDDSVYSIEVVQAEDNESVHSIEMIENTIPPLPGKETEQSKVEEADDDDDDSAYSIEDFEDR